MDKISDNDKCHEVAEADNGARGASLDWVAVGGLSDEVAFELSPDRQGVSYIKLYRKMP